MNVTSRINKPWMSWVGLICMVLMVTVLVGALILPMFSRARYASRPALEVAVPHASRQARQAASMPVEKTFYAQASSVPGVAWAASMNRMVIYTAEVSIETKEIEKQHREIARITRQAGGFITSSGITNSDGTHAAEVTVRIPQKGYASTLDAICKLGKLLSKNEKGEDVTEEYVDLQSRLRNLKREEEAFLTVLGKASRIADILAVERELSRVRGEIETAEGRVKYLDNQIQLSTITVSLTEPEPVVTASNIVEWDIWNTAKGAVNSLSGVFRAITSLIIWLVAFIPLWAVLGVVGYGVRRRFRRTS